LLEKIKNWNDNVFNKTFVCKKKRKKKGGRGGGGETQFCKKENGCAKKQRKAFEYDENILPKKRARDRASNE
jgi:hypothetical protein